MGKSVIHNSEGALNEDSETFQYLSTIRNPEKQKNLQNQTASYWGYNDRDNQKVGPASPTYLGSIIIFLFVLGILYIKHRYKYWILMSTILSVMLGWGYNLYGFSEFFIDFIPGYSKFRAVTMIMIIAEFGIALLAILALNKFLNKEDNAEKEKN